MEGQAVYSATPLRSNPSDTFIGNEVFDFDSVMMSDNDIYSQEFAVVSESSTGGVPSPFQTKFRFQYEDLDSWVDLAGSFIRTRFRLVSNGTTDTTGATIPDIRSLWEQTILSLGGKEIENHSKDQWAYAQMSNKMWSNKFLNTVGTHMGLYKTRAGQPGLEIISNGYDVSLTTPNLFPISVLDLAGTTPLPIANTTALNYCGQNGIGTLQSLEGATPTGEATVFTGAYVEFWTPLSTLFGFCQAFPRVIKGLKLQIDLFKASDKIRVWTPNGGNSPFATPANHNVAVEWDRQGVQLYVRRTRANESIERSLTSRLVSGINYRVTFEDWYMDRFNFGREELRNEHRIVNVGSLPTRVWTCFQPTDYLTNQGLPSWVMTIPNLTEIQLIINGQLVPQNIVKMNAVSINQINAPNQVDAFDDLQVPYQQYLAACGAYQNSSPYMRNFRGGSGCLSYEEWRSTFPIFCWDLDNIAITPFFEGRAEIVIKFTKLFSTTQDPPEPETGYTMFTAVHCLKTAELSFKDHTSYITMNAPPTPPP